MRLMKSILLELDGTIWALHAKLIVDIMIGIVEGYDTV
jgi:hypothetical protein